MGLQRGHITTEDGTGTEACLRCDLLHRSAVHTPAHDDLHRCAQNSLRSGIDMSIQPSLSRSSEQGNNESVQRHWFDHLLSVHGVSPRVVDVSAGAAAAANRSWNIR